MDSSMVMEKKCLQTTDFYFSFLCLEVHIPLILTRSCNAQKILHIPSTGVLLQIWLLAFGHLTTQKINDSAWQLK